MRIYQNSHHWKTNRFTRKLLSERPFSTSLASCGLTCEPGECSRWRCSIHLGKIEEKGEVIREGELDIPADELPALIAHLTRAAAQIEQMKQEHEQAAAARRVAGALAPAAGLGGAADEGGHP